ncbi:uncharacterized protein CLUP02_05258 [Colletotrichum lupini]|uniref:Uncharacterized protein n=1 Tax=Colletotrichum lupini TaxID=145971 RepID=A0A9Q8WDI9_9PEZI|nr:uncharacterized protein CLUP02_05258 [Colletotrichum lupini]UQC79778.1 hypothetical protein CLUP02_05258 [Colletotrichum lupini]
MSNPVVISEVYLPSDGEMGRLGLGLMRVQTPDELTEYLSRAQ